MNIHSPSIHQLHFYPPHHLGERERKRFQHPAIPRSSERQYLYSDFPITLPSFHHQDCWRRSFCHRGISIRAVDEHGILRHRLFSRVQFNIKRERKRKREQNIHYYYFIIQFKKAQLSLSRSKSYLSISHFRQTNRQTNLTRDGWEFRVVACFLTTTTTTTTTTTSWTLQLSNRVPSSRHTPGSGSPSPIETP